jgi:hypothetical protein
MTKSHRPDSPNFFRTFLLVFSTFLFCIQMMFGQATGRIGGTVLDSSGGVITGTTVTCTNVATGLSRTTETSSAGTFVFPDLPIGQYQVDVKKQGFRPLRTENVVLVTGQSLDMQLSLQVGDVNQAVEVTAEGELMQTTSSTVQSSVTQRQMVDLPLNGRNALQLTILTPGTVMTDVGTEAGQQDNRGIAVNGLRTTQNNFQLDGTIYTNRFFDSVPTMPNPDTLEEFTIKTSAYSAEFGGAGALVQLSTRSGSNEYHGTVFEFFRNTQLNARNFFQLTRPPYKQNQFGGAFGGPIRRNKAFFFVSAQDQVQRAAPSGISITPPSVAQRQGDFSALLPKTVIIDPAAGNSPFPGNIVPINRFNSVSQKVADIYLPLPNSGTQWVGSQLKHVDDLQWLAKVDMMLSSNNHFSARYFNDENDFWRTFNAPTGFYAANYFLNQSATITDTHIFSPTTTGAFYFSFGRFARTQVPQAPGLKSLQDLGVQVPLGTSIPIFPGVRANISGFVNVFSGGALRQYPTSFVWKATGTKMAGAHTLNFGVEFERTRVDVNDYSYVPGDNTFNGQVTGNAVSDFFLGYPSQFFQDNGRTLYLRESRPSLFFQDDWKVSRQFTVNLGVRWEPWLAPIDQNNALTAFAPGKQSVVAPNAPLGLLFPGDAGVADSIFKHNWKTIAPRIGFAWNVSGDGKTVIRGGAGIFYSFPEGLLYQRTNATQPTDLYLSIPNPPSFTNPYQGFPGGNPFPRAHIQPSQFASYKFILPVSGGMLDPSSKVGYTENWNLTVERQLRSNMVLTVAYVGNHGVNIMGSRQLNPALYYSGATVAQENNHRLFPGMGAVEYASSYEYAHYHSLQTSLTQRLTRGLTLLGNVVWSKTIDNNSSAAEGVAGPHNPFNFDSARGPADFDQKFRFNLSTVYNTPHLNMKGVGNTVLNDWQINVITAILSGMPFTVTSGTDRSISGIGNDYADLVGNATRPAGADQLAQYFNTAAFTPAALGTFGNLGRNVLRAPGSFNMDISLFKNFKFTEKRYLQFRAEAFNIENRANFSAPTSALNSGTFGKITAAADPRVLQFALKLAF